MEKKMIEQKNELLKEAGNGLREIWNIALMLDHSDFNNRHFDTLIKLVNNRLRAISCRYDEYLDESEIYLPEAEEGDPESELEALEKELAEPEPTIDEDTTEDDLPFVTPTEEVEA